MGSCGLLVCIPGPVWRSQFWGCWGSTSVGAQIDTKGFLLSFRLIGLNIEEAGEGGCCLFFAHKFLPNDSFFLLETTSHSLARYKQMPSDLSGWVIIENPRPVLTSHVYKEAEFLLWQFVTSSKGSSRIIEFHLQFEHTITPCQSLHSRSSFHLKRWETVGVILPSMWVDVLLQRRSRHVS